MKPLKALVGLGGLVALLSANAAANTVTVHIYSFDFSVNPQGQPVVDPTINVGDTIHWVWDGGFHNTMSVAGIPEQWDSGMSSVVGHTFDHTFTNVGTFWYYCDPHGFDNGDGTAGGMAGTITVVPEPVSSIALLGGLGLLAARRRRRA